MPVTARSVSATKVRAPNMKSSLFDRAGIGYSKAVRASRSLSHALVMGASVDARHPVHVHTAFAGARGPQPEIDRHSRWRAAAIRSLVARSNKVDRSPHADPGGEPRHSTDHAQATERERADSVCCRRWH